MDSARVAFSSLGVRVLVARDPRIFKWVRNAGRGVRVDLRNIWVMGEHNYNARDALGDCDQR